MILVGSYGGEPLLRSWKEENDPETENEKKCLVK